MSENKHELMPWPPMTELRAGRLGQVWGDLRTGQYVVKESPIDAVRVIEGRAQSVLRITEPETEPSGVIMDEAIEPAPERKPIVARQAEIDAAERRIWSDAGVSEYAPIDPAAWAKLRPRGKSRLGEMAVAAGLAVKADAGGTIKGVGLTGVAFDETATIEFNEHERPVVSMAMLKPLVFQSVQVKKEVPPLLTAKPVLLVPEGCTLVIPDGVDPREFMAGFQVEVKGCITNKSGYATLGKVAEQQEVRAVEAKRTHAALTFEQPIQNRLGRMAK